MKSRKSMNTEVKGRKDAVKKASALLTAVFELLKPIAETHKRKEFCDGFFEYLGLWLKELGLEEEAIAVLIIAVEMNPENVEPQYGLAEVYSASGKYKEAIKEYNKLLHLSPDYKLAYMGLGRIYLRHGLREQAIQAYKKLAEVDPEDMDTRRFVGFMYLGAGKIVEAIKEFSQLTEKDKSFARKLLDKIAKAAQKGAIQNDDGKFSRQQLLIDPQSQTDRES